MATKKTTDVSPELQRILDANHHDPFSVLGRHSVGQEEVIRAFLPRAKEVRIANTQLQLERIGETDLFQWQGKTANLPRHYRLTWQDEHDHTHIKHDPYSKPQ